MAKKKAQSEQTTQALANMQKSVDADIADYKKLMALVSPPLSAWMKRRKAQVKLAQDSAANYDFDFETVQDWRTMIEGLGQIFQSERQLGIDTTQEAKGLLAFLWRATYLVSFRVGLRERESFIDLFGLRSPVTKKPNASQIKRLNAQQHRPLCIAQAIMDGAIPFKRDSMFGSFVKDVLTQEYTSDGKELTSDDMSSIIERHWDKFVGCATKKAMLNAFTGIGYALNPDQQVNVEKAAKEKVITDTVQAAVAKTGHVTIDERGNLNDEQRQEAHAKLDKEMRRKGFYPIGASKPLYVTLKILSAPKGKHSKERIEQSIIELQSQLQTMVSKLVDKTNVKIAGEFVQSALDAHSFGLIEITRNGKRVEIVPTPKSESLAA